MVDAAFPECAPIAFSTPRGGRHLHYALAAPAWAERVSGYGRDRLTAAGVQLRAGEVELFPSGAKLLRAPLGRGCYLLDPHTWEPVSLDRRDNLEALGELLGREQYDRLEVPASYGANETPRKLGTGPRRRVQASPSEFMQECDRLLREGLWRTSQRNDACLKLAWLMRVVWGFDAERTRHELVAWLDAGHNGCSREYLADPAKARRKVAAIVAAFRPEKVGTGTRRAPGARVRPPDGRVDLDGAIGAFVDGQALDGRERRFLARLLAYAHRRGADTLDGTALDVAIPFRTLKTWDWQYGPILRLLLSQGCVELAGRYGAQIGRCNSYRVPRLDGPKTRTPEYAVPQ